MSRAATGEPFATYADPGAEGANAILESSTAGAAVWAALNGFERAAILRNGSRVVEAHGEELAILADRVLVMREGRLSGELAGHDITEARIIELSYHSAESGQEEQA